MIGVHAFCYLSKVCKKNFLEKEKKIMGVAGLRIIYAVENAACQENPFLNRSRTYIARIYNRAAQFLSVPHSS